MDEPRRPRQGIDAIRASIEAQEIGIGIEAAGLMEERKDSKSLDWIETKIREVFSRIEAGTIDNPEALRLIAAVVDYPLPEPDDLGN